MNAVHDTKCPADETLAAFIDGRLDGDARREVVEHIADCAICRDIVLMADEIAAVGVIDAPANVVRPKFGSRWLAPVTVAASLLVVVFLSWDRIESRWTGRMSEVVEAYQHADERLIQTRLSGLPFKPFKSPLRGSDHVDAPYLLEEAQLQLEQAKGERSWKEYRALAAVRLLRGERDGAAAAIDQAANLAPDEPVVLNDRAAVYIEQARWNSDNSDYAQRALAAAEEAWRVAQTRESAWNRAVALELVKGRDQDAITAWDEYLKRDPSSPWAAEAQSNRDTLKERNSLLP